MVRKRKIPVYLWRRLSQLLFFVLFLFLFIKTDYTGSDELEYAVNILFRIDPLLALAAIFAGKTIVALMLPAVFTLVFTLVFGRSFCGWICPMGTLVDGAATVIRPPQGTVGKDLRPVKYYLLIFILVAALLGLPLAGYLDPFSLLVRAFSFAVYPAVDFAVSSFFTFTYQHAPDWVNAVSEPVYDFLKNTVLPFSHRVYGLGLLSLLLFALVLVLNHWQRRFFCRNLCPLGGLLALVSRFSLLTAHGGNEDCGKCRQCRAICRMGAIDEDRRISPSDCNLCLDCVALCPRNKIHLSFHRPQPAAGSYGMTRRAFAGTVATGALLPLFLPGRPLAQRPDPLLIRPPGALPEEEFLGRCVRCGECMKVCIGNALHSAFLEAGIAGMFTPMVRSRIGYCEYNCTLCGQVCPTGAIRKLALPAKHATVIGRAFFDKNLCLPYAKGIPCIVCEEHCPTPDKAIKFRPQPVVNSRGETVTVLQPFVVDELCIGCGICENKCPLPGRAAVRVTSEGQARPPGQALTGW